MDNKDDVKYPPNGNSYVEDDINDEDDDDDEEEEEEIFIEEFSDDDDDDDGCGVQRIAIDDYADNDDDEDYGSSSKHPKKKKLKSLLSSYEFAPRVPPPPPSSALPPSVKSKPSNGKRNPLTDWTERESFILLDAWGERYLNQGRKSLRLEEWQEVAQKVSKESEFVRTDTQCRNRLDTLKKKYKKEKSKFGDDDAEGSKSDWVYFKKMDTLLSSSLPQKYGLSCGVDSGEYVFMNPKVYLNSSNGLDEMRDSPGNSEDETRAEKKNKKQVNGEEDSFKLLADAISKFSSIYERVEESKRQQMIELEKMRMDFYSDLELEKRQIIERARDEFVKIRQGNDRDNDNDSG